MSRLILFLLLFGSLSVEAQVAARRNGIGLTFGGQKNDRGITIKKTADGHLLLIGFTESFSASQDLYIIKTDSRGQIIWSRNFGDKGFEAGWDFEEVDKNKSYLIAGFSSAFGTNDEDITLFKVSNNGELLWTKCLPAEGSERCWSIEKLSDGCFVLTGQTRERKTGNYDGLITKIDGEGNIIWQTRVGKPETYDRLFYCTETKDKNLLVTGISRKDSTSENTGLVVLLDKNGKEKSLKQLSQFRNTTTHGILPMADDEIWIYGYAQTDTSKAQRAIYLACFSSDASLKWEKTVDSDKKEVHGLSAVKTKKGILLAGYVRSLDPNANWDAIVYSFNRKASLKRKKVFKGNKADQPYTITPVSPDKFAITGNTQSFGNGMQDVWLFFINGKLKLIE